MQRALGAGVGALSTRAGDLPDQESAADSSRIAISRGAVQAEESELAELGAGLAAAARSALGRLSKEEEGLRLARQQLLKEIRNRAASTRVGSEEGSSIALVVQ